MLQLSRQARRGSNRCQLQLCLSEGADPRDRRTNEAIGAGGQQETQNDSPCCSHGPECINYEPNEHVMWKKGTHVGNARGGKTKK